MHLDCSYLFILQPLGILDDTTMAQMESLDTYTFDLRRGLRDAARVGLGQLEEMIGEIGYGWLDGHMEGILERTSR